MADTDIIGPSQYLRRIKLFVSGNDDNGLNLSELRIKFTVKLTGTATPNTADIRVYNLKAETALQIRKEFTRVTLQAGYPGNIGVIFQGNIKQVIVGRESATDTYIDIVAGDGDQAYNFAVVNTTIAKGSTLRDQIKAAISAMTPKGVDAGHLGDQPGQELPRGKVMYGNSRNYLTMVAQTTESNWSIQNEKVTFVEKKAYLPGERVILNAQTGMIGTPQQTNDGVNIKCLLNPNLKISALVQIDNASIIQQKLNLEQIAAAKGNTSTINGLIPRNLSADGVYFMLVIEHTGDTRGIEWYSSMICLNVDTTTNPRNSVQSGLG